MQELEKALGFSNFDYKYLIENLNIPLHTFTYCRYYILAQRIPRSFKRTIKGVVYYSGVIELPQHIKKNILRDSDAVLSHAYLDSLQSIKTLESCSKELLFQLFENNFEVKPASSINELDLSQCDAILIDEENRDLLHHKDTPLPQSLNIKFEDLVLKRELVDWCKLQLNIEEATPNTREHAIKEQIRIIHRDNPS